jgi:HAD superfamily hydrolase (TIGR01509 family)
MDEELTARLEGIVLGVGFDFDHTLALDHRLEHVALLHVLERHASAARESSEAWGGLIDQTLHLYRHGVCDLESALQRLFTKVCGPACEPNGLFGEFVDEALALAPSHVTAIPGAQALLARLDAAGIATAILTNGWNPFQQKKIDLIGYTGPVIVSDDIHARKPAQEAFAALARLLHMPPEQILYIGDSPEIDVAGAIGAGMRAVWFNWEGQVYPTHLPDPEAVIEALERVDELVFANAP